MERQDLEYLTHEVWIVAELLVGRPLCNIGRVAGKTEQSCLYGNDKCDGVRPKYKNLARISSEIYYLKESAYTQMLSTKGFVFI